MKHVFIIGSKGIPAKYGGFETFVEKLTEYKVSESLQYHVACMGDKDMVYNYNGAECIQLKIPNIGPAKAVYYDIAALKKIIGQIRKMKKQNAAGKDEFLVYILACRIGPFVGRYKRKLNRLGIKLFLNPDGHEWKRAKWSAPIRKYWKLSERLMVKNADLLICDSKNIEKYIKKEYSQYNPNTTYIAYGADVKKSKLKEDDSKLLNWYNEKGLTAKSYYLIVGRFVPENNYETMIREFMHSDSKKDLVIITNVEKNKFYKKLREKTNFEEDNRIKFVGTVYDAELLKKIRELAYGYFHGHEVGGTNPSLIEALGSTELNLLLDVGFNREVAEEGALYWNKEQGNLAALIHKADRLSQTEIAELSAKAKKRITEKFSWNYIVEEYEKILLNNR